MNVRITQLDGALPNIALMKISSYHRSLGHEIFFSRSVEKYDTEPEYDIVYGSAIFKFSQLRLMKFMSNFPNAIIGGTGTHSVATVEETIGQHEGMDYSLYPEVDYSIGFTQRGCRLKCKFCVVPTKEGKNRPEGSIYSIWRGDPHPKKLHILDNDFFGNPEWRDRIKEIREGKFRVCLSQGINTRLIDDESAEALASIEYRNTKFDRRVLYTAWDNLKDEGVFFTGVDRLERAGIRPSNLMTYMLIGFDKSETWDRIWYRFNRMVERGIKPYPMVFDRSRKDLLAFQRWVVMGLYRVVPWKDYDSKNKSIESVTSATALEGLV